MNQFPPDAGQYLRILPELVLTIFGAIVMLVDPLLPPQNNRKQLGIISLIGAIAAIVATFMQRNHTGNAFYGMIRVDAFSIFFHYLVGIVAVVVILASFEYLNVQRIRHGEYYGLILFGSVGMMLMSSAVELVLIFIALEISSIATYILAGFRRHAVASAESSIKYFLLGSFATAFFLYGIALMFGATGSTNIYEIARNLNSGSVGPMAYVAVAMMFVGIGFKIASAPFHVWTPDVYEGAPAPVVGLMSTGPKAAAFAVLLRILFAAGTPGWFWLIWVSAALSMTLGNIGALVQNNVKRLLAYSSIAHAGYLLVAFAVPHGNEPQMGISAAIFYTATYAIMNVGAFAIVSHLASSDERYVTLDDYAGLSRRSPWLAAMLTVFLLSLIGIPATGGFLAKFYVFTAAMKANLIGLTIIGVVNSAVAAYYYARVIVAMYMREGRADAPAIPLPASVATAVALSAAITLYLGLWPQRVLDYALRSANELLR